jgi:Protein of unknown function (DUF4231)
MISEAASPSQRHVQLRRPEGTRMTRRDDGPVPARTMEAVPTPDPKDPTWERLESQLEWYDLKASKSQWRYKWLKVLEIAVAATLPVVAAVHSPVWVTGGLAAVVVVLEGVQHIFQFQEHWITYRSTAEALKRERYLYLAKAGPYTDSDPDRLLAERVDTLLSQEHAKWAASSQRDASPHQGQR